VNKLSAHKEMMCWPIAAIGCMVIGLMAALFWHAIAQPAVEAYQVFRAEATKRAGVWDGVVLPRLRATEAASAATASGQIKAVETFFAERKARAREFAEAVLSWRGKWNFIADKLPWAEEGRHRRYLEDRFSELIFDKEELERMIQGAVEGYVTRLEGLEYQLVVDLRQDLKDSEWAVGHARIPETLETFQAEYQEMMKAVLPILHDDLGASGGKLAANVVGADIGAAITSRITTACVTRLGMTGTIMGIGLDSSVVTFGGGLVAAFVVDHALDSVLRYFGHDPEEQIASEVRGSLNAVCRAIVEGNSGMRQSLKELHGGRARLREAALRKLIMEGGRR
jgi:hypothetical protein